jgi:hypothetical protein
MYADRRSLLSSLIAKEIGDQEIDSFLEDRLGRPGRYLIMDPHEVLGDEWDAPFFARIFDMIEKGQTEGLAELDHEGSVVAGLRNGPDSYRSGVFGHGWGR